MHIFTGRDYESQRSDLGVHVVKIQYKTKEYVKFKGILYNKYYGYVYETKNYKLKYSQISHWYEVKRSFA